MSDPVKCLRCGEKTEIRIWRDLGFCPYCGYGKHDPETEKTKGWDRFLELSDKVGLKLE